jgi:hypothetical protein
MLNRKTNTNIFNSLVLDHNKVIEKVIEKVISKVALKKNMENNLLITI